MPSIRISKMHCLSYTITGNEQVGLFCIDMQAGRYNEKDLKRIYNDSLNRIRCDVKHEVYGETRHDRLSFSIMNIVN